MSSKRLLQCVLGFSLTLLSSYGQSVDVTYKIDDVLTPISTTRLNESDLCVPIIEATSKFSQNIATCQPSEDGADILVDGVRIVHLSKNSDTAQIFDPSRSDVLAKTWQMDVPLIDDHGSGTFVIDIKTLCDLLGDSVEISSDRINIYTAKYWALRLGLDGSECAKATIRNLAWMPAIGVTPPGDDMLVWIRPEKQSKQLFAQIYDLSSKTPRPQLVVDPQGIPAQHPLPGYEPKARTFDHDEPIQLETQMLKSEDHMSYAVVVFRSDPITNPLAVIKQKELESSEYIVFGVHQRTQRLSRNYSRIEIKSPTKISDFAHSKGFSAGLIAQLNGFIADELLHSGEKLIVPDRWDSVATSVPSKSYRKSGEYYEIKVGDTFKDLAKTWGVNQQWIIQANPQVLADHVLRAGDWIEAISPIEAQAERSEPVTRKGPVLTASQMFRGKLVRQTTVFKDLDLTGSSKDCIKGLPLFVTGEVHGAGKDLYRVEINNELWYVPTSCVEAKPAPLSLVAKAGNDKITRTALKYLGVPYHFGSANIHQEGRIDCSNFVAEVFAEAGYRSPEPPVHNQETVGDVVHLRGVSYERGGEPKSDPEEQGLENLRTGDRIIIQIDPTKNVPGWHHTGIYIGPLNYEGHQYRHAVIHAGKPCVQITELTDPRLWSNYRFSVRSRDLPPR